MLNHNIINITITLKASETKMELHFKAVSALSEKKVAEIQIHKRIPVVTLGYKLINISSALVSKLRLTYKTSTKERILHYYLVLYWLIA